MTAFPRDGIDFHVAAAGGPRLLGLAELEQIRDGLAVRLAEAREELGRRADAEESNRGLVERMIADPEEYRWVRVSNEDVGERGCKHWHSRPRFGILGMLLGWWRVKLSSGCPLATGRASGARPELTPLRVRSRLTMASKSEKRRRKRRLVIRAPASVRGEEARGQRRRGSRPPSRRAAEPAREPAAAEPRPAPSRAMSTTTGRPLRGGTSHSSSSPSSSAS